MSARELLDMSKGQLVARCGRLAAELAASRAEADALRGEVARLREALKPFADMCKLYAWPWHDDAAPVLEDSGTLLRLGDLRRAARALAEGGR